MISHDIENFSKRLSDIKESYLKKCPEGYKDFFVKFPATEFFRFYVEDYRYNENVFLDFEKSEPGYFKSLIMDQLRCLTVDFENLTESKIQEVHYYATEYVTKFETNLNTVIRGDYGFSPSCFSLCKENVLIGQGFNEILIDFFNNSGGYDLYYIDLNSNFNAYTLYEISEKVSRTDMSREDLTNKFNIEEKLWYISSIAECNERTQLLSKKISEFIGEYNKINNDKDPAKTLYAIVNLIIRLERLHPFDDANCRAFCMRLLNELLIANGFPPAMLANPNYFDSYSRQNLCLEVIRGMEKSLAFIDNEKFVNERIEETESAIAKLNIKPTSNLNSDVICFSVNLICTVQCEFDKAIESGNPARFSLSCLHKEASNQVYSSHEYLIKLKQKLQTTYWEVARGCGFFRCLPSGIAKMRQILKDLPEKINSKSDVIKTNSVIFSLKDILSKKNKTEKRWGLPSPVRSLYSQTYKNLTERFFPTNVFCLDESKFSSSKRRFGR